MSGLSDHAKGLLITAAGVLAITPDSLLVRLVDTDVWTLVFWRGLLMAFGIGVGLLLVHRGETWARCRAVGANGLLITALFTATTVFFVTALDRTTVANTLIIVSSAPLFAALFSRLFLAEAVPLRTWMAILATLGGIAILVSGSLGQGTLVGDLAALAATIGLAGSFTAMRRGRAVSMVPATALSGVTSAALALLAGTLLGGAPAALAPEAWTPLLLMGLLVLPVSTALITLGPRYIPAAEVGLLMPLETVLGPLWVWLALGEEPGPRALLGGTVVVVTLMLHAIAGLRAARAAGAPA